MKGRVALRGWVLALAMSLGGPVFATGFGCPQPPALNAPPATARQLALVDRVNAAPERPVRRARDLNAWLKRLEGRYTYEGHVHPCDPGLADARQAVTGRAECVLDSRDSGEVPIRGVYCTVDARWPQVRGKDGAPLPGGESRLSPAVIIFDIAPDQPLIRSMQVDSKGITTHAEGQVTGDTLVTREPCDTVASCQKVTWITARADGKEISMLVDFEVDSVPVLRQAFLLRRVEKSQARPGR